MGTDPDDRRLILTPAQAMGRNLDQMGPILPVVDYTVGSWTPARDGQGKATQVHLVMQVALPGVSPPESLGLQLRLKSAAECDRLIEALRRHRVDVWPSAGHQILGPERAVEECVSL